MTRRSFFRVLGMATLTAPTVVPLVGEKLSTVTAWWKPVEWWEKEFDFGRSVGYAMSFRNVLTGETVRNAVRFRNWPQERLGWSKMRLRAKAALRAWGAELPPWRAPGRLGHGDIERMLADCKRWIG